MKRITWYRVSNVSACISSNKAICILTMPCWWHAEKARKSLHTIKYSKHACLIKINHFNVIICKFRWDPEIQTMFHLHLTTRQPVTHWQSVSNIRVNLILSIGSVGPLPHRHQQYTLWMCVMGIKDKWFWSSLIE